MLGFCLVLDLMMIMLRNDYQMIILKEFLRSFRGLPHPIVLQLLRDVSPVNRISRLDHGVCVKRRASTSSSKAGVFPAKLCVTIDAHELMCQGLNLVSITAMNQAKSGPSPNHYHRRCHISQTPSIQRILKYYARSGLFRRFAKKKVFNPSLSQLIDHSQLQSTIIHCSRSQSIAVDQS